MREEDSPRHPQSRGGKEDLSDFEREEERAVSGESVTPVR